MPFTVTDFHDLIRLLEEHADWRTELRRVLFSQDLLDLPRTVQELAIAQRRTEEALTRLTERLEQGFAEAATERGELRQDLVAAAADRQRIRERLEQGFAEAATERGELRQDLVAVVAGQRELRQDVTQLATDQRELRQDVGRLKGMGQEGLYRGRAAAIFGRFLTLGRDATSQVADHLQEARRIGSISDEEYQEVLAADLLWAGQVRDMGRTVVLVLEASWTVQVTDVERATERAAVLRRAGLTALPVAAGQEWPSDVQAMARRDGVVIVQDGMADRASWEAARASL